MNEIEQSTFELFKKAPVKSIKHTTYFSVYDELFSKYKDKNIVFIEIGVFQGGSLFMWREYFGEQARIIGIDINPGAKKWEKDGFEIFIGSQSDPQFWVNFFNIIGEVDIILDDGGHTFEQQIITAESVLHNIKDGGMHVVEDTHTSYMPDYGGASNASFISYAKNMIDGLNYRYEHFKNKKTNNKSIFSMQFFESFVVFNVNRKLSSIESIWIENDGETMPPEYFVNSQSKVSKTFSTVLKKNKHIKTIALMVYRTFMPLIIRVKNSIKLKKFFKY
jgi:cephalosporin hydroxylase